MHMHKGWKIVVGAPLIMGCILIALGLMAKGASADISNPHPTPPSNSITNVMLQTSIINPNNINIPQQFEFQNVVATSTTVATSTVTGALVAASSTFTGEESHNGVVYTFPSSQGANGSQIQNDGSGNLSWSTPSNHTLIQQYTAAETLGAGEFVAFGDLETATTTFTDNGGTGGPNPISVFAASVTPAPNPLAGITGVTVKYTDYNEESCTETFNIYVEGGTATVPSGTIAAQGQVTLSFSNPANSKTGAIYFASTPIGGAGFVWVITNGASGNCTTMEMFGSTSGTGQLGSASTIGGTYTLANFSGGVQYGYTSVIPSDVYGATAKSNNFRYKDFLGITEAAATAGQSVTIDIAGTSIATTTQTAGTEYFLADATGTVSTSAGTNSLKVGISQGTFGFLLRPALP
jgi:hypothetical protein